MNRVASAIPRHTGASHTILVKAHDWLRLMYHCRSVAEMYLADFIYTNIVLIAYNFQKIDLITMVFAYSEISRFFM